MIPITTVQFGADEEALVLEVLRSGSIAQGPKVAELETDVRRQRSDRKHAIAVNNGTTALIAALQVLDLQPGDEVITTPFTFVATLNAILEAGATAVFADIRDDDFNIDPASVAAQRDDRTRRCSCPCTSTGRWPTWIRWSRSRERARPPHPRGRRTVAGRDATADASPAPTASARSRSTRRRT